MFESCLRLFETERALTHGSLSEITPIEPSLKVLDFGCGTAMSSIGLSRDVTARVRALALCSRRTITAGGVTLRWLRIDVSADSADAE